MRLVDADELRNELSNKDYITYTYEYGDAIPIDWVIGAIDNAPTVEITEEQAIDKLHDTGWLLRHDKEMTERPTGHWIKVTDCYCWHWECENCHRRPSRTSTGHDDLSNFCPNCGADMRKEAENDNK